ncbi:MAG: hypothetical protein OXE17_09770 [Chloroflexi bacterium]|nr:hypothetical protein [Chloroflexota bacterium]
MTEQQPKQEFRDLVDAATTPTPTPSATIRVAEFHFGGGSLVRAIEAAGIDVVASLDASQQIPNFDTMGEFDIVLADVSEEGEYSSAVQFLLRFLFVRRPPAFVVLGSNDEAFCLALVGASRPYGYEVSRGGGDFPFIAGVSEREPEEEIWGKINQVVQRIGEDLGTAGQEKE